MQNNVASSLNVLRQQAGYYDADDYGLLSISGNDAATYLQSQTSNDINQLLPGCGQFTCLLDRKAHVLAYFHLFKSQDNSFFVIAEKEQIPAIISHLKQFRFAADVQFCDLSEEGKFIVIAGPKCDQLLNGGRIFQHSITGDHGYFIWAENKDYEQVSRSISDSASKLSFSKLTTEIVEIARIEAGLVKFGIDFDSDNLLPETGLEPIAVSYTKGCFTGQEILARVKSHGVPAKALIGLVIDSNQSFPINNSVSVSGEEIGIIKSNVFSPTLNKLIALALLKRDYRVADKQLTVNIGNELLTATVTMLPFVHIPTKEEMAKRFYDQAVNKYIKETDNSMPAETIALLKQALALNPKLEDAYEALAVISGKHDRLVEAIALMKQLSQMNPDSVMAHSNLSQFYIQQGNKELAEEEKAIALGIRMRLAAAEVAAQAKKKEEANKDSEETKRRMNMFEEVLAIDSEDFFANAGVGECLAEMKDYEKAIPHLKKAIILKANHLPSYFALSKAYKESGSSSLAKNILQEGLELASKRGDVAALQQFRDELAAVANI